MKQIILTTLALLALTGCGGTDKQDQSNSNINPKMNKETPKDVAGRKNFGGAHPVITPLPCIMIATYDKDQTPDVMMAAWGGQCDVNRITFELSSHQTTDNLRLKRAFTVSFATARDVAESDYFGLVSGRDVKDKVARAGFTATPSPNVDAPIIDQYPLTLECRVVTLEDYEDGGARVVGEVVNWSADPSILREDGKVDLAKLQPICFDSSTNAYRVVGDSVGQAWGSGKKFKTN